MTDFHWSDFAVPATLLIVFMLIALATWLLNLLFPSSRAKPQTKNAAEADRTSKTARD